MAPLDGKVRPEKVTLVDRSKSSCGDHVGVKQRSRDYLDYI
jgi:hypothetical protein